MVQINFSATEIQNTLSNSRNHNSEMMKPFPRFFLLAGVIFLTSLPLRAAPERSLAQALQRLEETGFLYGVIVPVQDLRTYYQERGNFAAWTSLDTTAGLNARGRLVVEHLKSAAREGLDPAAYQIPDSASGAALELAVSAALLRYATDVRAGRKEPRLIDPELFLTRDGRARLEVLRNAATITDLPGFLETLPPPGPEYRGLRRALATYRAIAERGGWPSVSFAQTIKPGYSGQGLAALWERLRNTGDIDPAMPRPEVYDGALVEGVIRFQKRHGLAADGVIGPQSLAALNTSVARHIRQIELNMERWRWMPEDLGEAYVLVNLAGFDLRAVRRGKTVEAMSVIVGRPYRRTPVFSDRISYLEVNPDWTVPYKIAVLDILPKIRADPAFLAQNGFQVLPPGGAGASVNPATLDWTQYGPLNFPFLLRQLPGPKNALGQVKFMFPNRFAVYLHDTPARELFRKEVRTFSSGCIRVEQPMALARFLLDDDAVWTPDRLHREVETGKTKVVRLQKPVPVHLTYLTAWVGEDQAVHFRDDVYGRDARLATALFPKPDR